MKEVKFIIRDKTGHTTRMVLLEQINDVADELRDQGYMIVERGKLIPYGADLSGSGSVEAVPIPTKG